MRNATVLLLALGLGGCTLVLDYGDYTDGSGGAAAAGGGGNGAAGGQGGSGGQGGPGGAMTCTPDVAVDCYSGPVDTAGIGACKGGQQTCNAQGNGFGPCDGEVVPSAEIALNAGDEDCNGSAAGQGLWNVRFGAAGDQALKQVAIDGGDGTILLTGAYQEGLDLGSGHQIGPPAAPGPDLFVAKLDAGGAPLWIRDGQGEPVPRSGEGLAVDLLGNVNVAGHFTDAAQSAEPDGFVMQWGPEGDFHWLEKFGGPAADLGLGVATDAFANVVTIGRYRGSVTFSGGTETSVGDADDVLILKRSVIGAHVWSRSFGDDRNDVPRAVAINPAGDVFVTGEYQGMPAGLPDARDNMIAGHSAILAMKVTAGGAVHWTKGFPAVTVSVGNARGTAIAVDAEGGVWITGAMYQDTDFALDKGPLPSGGGADLFVARLDAGLGQVLWAGSFGDESDQQGSSIAVAEDGKVFVAGTFSGTIDFDPATPGNELTAQNGQDMFVVKLDVNGKPLWSARFAMGEGLGPRDVRLALHGGQVVLAGGWAGGLTFGSGGESLPLGGLDVFAAKLSQ